VKATTVTEEIKTSGRFITAYVDDRWKLSSSLLIEGGLFFESFQDENNNRSQVYPRIAAALKLFEKHVLRAGYLRWLDKITFGTLAPVTTAGLVIDNSLALQGSTLTDYQVRLESRWTDRLFTVIGVERVDLTDPNLGPGYQRRELTTKSLMAALNSILSKEIGVFLRYRYTDSQATGGYFDGKTAPWVPKNFVNGGMIWVSPLYVKVLAFANYVGSQYENFSNTRKISDYWTANLAATWEPFNKRVLFSFAVNNLFNSGAPAPARSFFFTLEYRL
jgi:outer membrane receptor for ferrienterochelin and colicin